MVNASDSLQIYDLGLNHPDHLAQLLHTVELPGYGTVGGGGSDPREKMLFFTYTSFTVPSMQFKIDLDNYKTELVSQTTISSKVGKPEDYITEQVWYNSKDGTKIPMFLVRKKRTLPDLESVPKKPIVTNLYAYGGFGSST
jgi:prolyl oligopeptidase